MGPSRVAAREGELPIAPQIGRKSVRAADDENSAGDRPVPPAFEVAGKSSTVDILAVFVERDKHGFFRGCRRNRRGFLGDARGGVACPAFGNFDDLDAAEAELAANIVESLLIAFSQLALRALFQPADGNHDEAHAHKLACAPADSISALKRLYDLCR